MIAVDTNVLVYAFNARAPRHRAALAVLRKLAEGQRPWGVPWPCVAEFICVVTDRRQPMCSSARDAWRFLDLAFASPSALRLLPTEDSLRVFREVVEESGAVWNDVHDAHIFALCLEHGVRELLTADRGFRRFKGLKVTDPFAA
jgi:hypothetical protein